MAKLGIAALVALLGGALWMMVSSLRHFSGGESMPTSGVVAMWLGIIFSLVVGVGLMALVFYSNRRGHDEPPQFKRDEH